MRTARWQQENGNSQPKKKQKLSRVVIPFLVYISAASSRSQMGVGDIRVPIRRAGKIVFNFSANVFNHAADLGLA
jgi:hypothetical protein